MLKGFPQSMTDLIREFSKMPGIGSKTAQRLAFYILKSSNNDAVKLAESIQKVKASVRFCRVCNNLSDDETCDVCSNPNRDQKVICVVETPQDLITVEKMGQFKGLYHVLLGALSPLDGIGPRDLKIHELIERVQAQSVREIIIATDSNTEGEATALYLIKLLKGKGMRVTRIASGLPVGANLEFADQPTLSRAFEGRVAV